ncbi:MAG TPA: hypothetical protein VN667_00405 [Burkholderiales bacterium]|nr:hypothetical protein [Burkholderiales bacterium]
MSQVEMRGKPAVAWTARTFLHDAEWSAQVWGRPEVGFSVVPECFTNNSPDMIRGMVDAAMDQVIKQLTHAPEPRAPQLTHITTEAGGELHYQGDDLLDCFDAMQRAFVKAHWSDGLPLVPPTRKKVEAMVAATGLAAGHLVGHLEPGFGAATLEKIAANAVMAGARPEHMPVILAMLDCFMDPRSGWRGVCMSTGPQAPVVMVSGRYAREIGMNSGVCAIGPGSVSEVNVAIGRTARLLAMNIGLSYPGVSDMDTHGTAMKFSYCVAENEERNPFEPYRVTKGFAEDSTTVTVNMPFSHTEVHDFQNHDPKRLIEVMCSVICNVGHAMNGHWLYNNKGPLGTPSVFRGESDNLLFLCPDHATAFHRAGWTLANIREALFEGSRLSFRKLMLTHEMELFNSVHPHLKWLAEAPETLISIFERPEQFDLFVIGGDAGWSTYHDGGTFSITREARLP